MGMEKKEKKERKIAIEYNLFPFISFSNSQICSLGYSVCSLCCRENILEKLNSFHPTIKWFKKSINFLDVKAICNEDDTLIPYLYTKPTDTQS